MRRKGRKKEVGCMRSSTVLLTFGLAVSTALASAQEGKAALDYEMFKTRVQPIFLAKRAGHARCVSCHAGGTPLRLEPLAPGATTWTEDQSRKNFAMRGRGGK